MRPHGGDSAIRAPSIDADTVTGNPYSVQFLNDWMISANSVAIGSHFEPFSAAVMNRVFWATIDIDSITITHKMELLYLLEDSHVYLQATYNYSRSVTPLESMTTIAW